MKYGTVTGTRSPRLADSWTRWFEVAPAGIACDCCNGDDEVLTITLNADRTVNLCSGCLRDAANFARYWFHEE